jgi:Membrane glycosyltransferase
MTFRVSTDLPREIVSLRQSLFLATGGGITIAGVWLLYDMYAEGGVGALEWVLMALFVVLFSQIAFGFSIALWGFLIRLRGERFDIMRTIDGLDESTSPGSTAIVMPVYNEDPARIFRGLENMLVSLKETGQSESFDLFILSDSNQPENWVDEECAWASLCSRLQLHGRVYYRKRRVSLHGKSGNIADFCRRWGRRYRYLVILDADSVMTGKTLVRLARAMDANPTVGIIQTAPKIVRGISFFQRLTQFATHTLGPLFAAGSNFWHLAGGSYWGHNAIIRLQPFMDHCVLPELPGRTADDRHILSHDTVEAALMQQAGYQVWFAFNEDGSYEEGPPNLSESLKRDRRWAQGNLQHFWFLLAPRTHFTNRIHMFFGLMAYLSAPLLVIFIVLSAIDYHGKMKAAIYADRLSDPAWTEAWRNGLLLLSITLLMLFGAKLLGWLHTLPRARQFGGMLRMTASTLLETVTAVLLAPILLWFHTKFVVLTLLGLRVSWKTQNRSDSRIPFAQAVREYGMLPLAGAVVLGVTLYWMPVLTLWLSPILAGWLLAVPLVMVTSSDEVGQWLRRRGLLVIPEETAPPEVLRGLDAIPPALVRPGSSSNLPHYGFAQVLLAPWANAVHIALLRRSNARSHYTAALENITQQLLALGPDAIGRRERMALLWNADALATLHRRIWQTPEENLHPWWREAMHACAESPRSRKE